FFSAFFDLFSSLNSSNSYLYSDALRLFGTSNGHVIHDLTALLNIGNAVAHGGYELRERDDLEFVSDLATTRKFVKARGEAWVLGRDLFQRVTSVIASFEAQDAVKKQAAKQAVLGEYLLISFPVCLVVCRR